MHPPTAASANDPVESGFRLSGLSVEPRAGEVAGPGGTEKLDPKVMDVLVMLAKHAGKVVPREDLLSRLWPGVVVTDESLSRCIYELRRQLTQAGGDEKFKDLIETLPKRGYRLKGDVAPLAPEPASRPRPGRSTWILVAVLAVAAAIAAAFGIRGSRDTPTPAAAPSIAVLPFADMSQTKDQAYLADGISEEILNRLAQAGDLRVIARTSSFALRDSGLDVVEIAEKLKVTHVLEGSIRRSGDKVRVTAQLISASDSSHVWSDTYDRKIFDLLSVQDEIAIAVATALEISLSGDFAAPRSTANAEAYEEFLRAEFFYYRRAPGDVERAISNYQEAVRLDPQFARAWASLSGAYSLLGYTESAPPSEALRTKQGQAAQRAVELDPNLAIAHARLAQFHSEGGDHETARKHSARAKALDPDEPFVLSDTINEAIGRGDMATAIEIQRAIVARDPLAGIVRQLLGVYLLADGQFSEALSQFRKVQEIHPDGEAGISSEIAPVLVLLRRFDAAEAEAAKLPDGKTRDQAMALVYAATGREQQADALLARLAQSQDGIFDTIRIAEIYAYRGMTDEAFAFLQDRKRELLREHGTNTGHVWYLQQEARLSPFLKTLHADSLWAAFMAPAVQDVTVEPPSAAPSGEAPGEYVLQR